MSEGQAADLHRPHPRLLAVKVLCLVAEELRLLPIMHSEHMGCTL